MSLKKITEEEILQNGVISAPDILTGTPAQNKAIFDRLTTDVVIEKFNDLIDALTAPTGAGEIGAKLGKTLAAALLSDDVDALRVNADGLIEVRRKGSSEWTSTIPDADDVGALPSTGGDMEGNITFPGGFGVIFGDGATSIGHDGDGLQIENLNGGASIHVDDNGMIRMYGSVDISAPVVIDDDLNMAGHNVKNVSTVQTGTLRGPVEEEGILVDAPLLMDGNAIKELPDPIDDGDATNKKFVGEKTKGVSPPGGSTNWVLAKNSGTDYDVLWKNVADLIATGAITNAKLNNMAANTIKGRLSSTGAPQDLTAEQVRTLLDIAGQYLSLAGGTMSGHISMGQHSITGLDSIKFYDTQVIQGSPGILGFLSNNGADPTRLMNIATPQTQTEAANKAYADTKLPSAGGDMLGNINMNNKSLLNVLSINVNDIGIDTIMPLPGGDRVVIDTTVQMFGNELFGVGKLESGRIVLYTDMSETYPYINLTSEVDSAGTARLRIVNRDDAGEHAAVIRGVADPEQTYDAVNLQFAFNNYVAKTLNANRVYGTDGAGVPIQYSIDRDAATPNTIARRTAAGQVLTTDPAADGHAATKKYVDDHSGSGDFKADGSVPMTGDLYLTQGKMLTLDIGGETGIYRDSSTGNVFIIGPGGAAYKINNAGELDLGAKNLTNVNSLALVNGSGVSFGLFGANAGIQHAFSDSTYQSLDFYCGTMYIAMDNSSNTVDFGGAKIDNIAIPTGTYNATTKGYVDSKTLLFTAKGVATTDWTSDSTYSAQGYNFRAAVTCAGVTANHRPDIAFGAADAVGGNFAPVVDSYAGGVYIYAKTKPTATVTIPSIVCVRGA
jgi:hypothetical protein